MSTQKHADTGSARITDREIVTQRAATLTESFWCIAAKRGCPTTGYVIPHPHPDYSYRTTHYADDRATIIEWEKRP